MRQESIEEDRAVRRQGAIWSAVYHVLFQLAATILPVLLIRHWEDMPRGMYVFCMAAIILCLIPIIPILVSLSQRIKEIEKGEEYEARKY